MSTFRKGRTAMTTINDLFESARWRIALENYETDPMLMKAILIELTLEATNVCKYNLIRQYNLHSSLNAGDMVPLLKQFNDFNSWNIYWKLSPEEQQYYLADPKFKLPKEERQELFNKIHKNLMQYKVDQSSLVS